MKQKLPLFLTQKKLRPTVTINPDLNFLGTESAFDFGAKVAEVEKSGKFERVYKFHIGDTGPKTPEPIINTAIQTLKDKQTKYAPFLGFPQVRENIARHLNDIYGAKVKKENVILQPGGKPAIELAMQALLGPNDYVVGQNPGFPIYESLARFYTKGKYIPWLAKHNKKTGILEFDVDDLEKIFKKRKNIKLVVVNTPQNPTGMMLEEGKLRKIAALVKKYKCLLLFDDIYDAIVFGNRKHFSVLSIPGMIEHTINLSGYSKDFAMTGWRLGYIVAPEWLIEIFGKLAINKWSCVSRQNQIVAGTIFGDVEVDGCVYKNVWNEVWPIVASSVKEYERKGNFLVDALSLLRPYVIPNEVEGAFYEFPNISGVLSLPYVKKKLKINIDKDFSEWLLKEKGFAALAGSDFGDGGRGHIRLSYAEDAATHIIPGIRHFGKVVIELIEKSKLVSPISCDEFLSKVGELEKKYFSSADSTQPAKISALSIK